MKLATYNDGSRDGQLVVVSRDLSTAHYATGIANKLQQVLDDWNFLSPQLQDLYDALNRGGESSSNVGMARHAFAFDPKQCMAPLPRAYQRVDGPSYPHPLVCLQQCASDNLSGPRDDVVCTNEEVSIGFDTSLAVISGDVARGATPMQALDGIRLLMLVNDAGERSLDTDNPAAVIETAQGQLASAFSPVAVTPDECGSAWVKGRLHLTLETSLNGQQCDPCEVGSGMNFHFGQLIAQFCKYCRVGAGCIFGSGPIGKKDAKPATNIMKYGDTLMIDMKGLDHQSLFGVIEQRISALANTAATRN